MLQVNEIFTFGSNEAGKHGLGAARVAYDKFGAIYGRGVGLHGQSYAIPTKDRKIQTLHPLIVEKYVNQFKNFAQEHTGLTFYVTKIGTGLAGFTDEEIAPMFEGSPVNCIFDIGWKPYLGNVYQYFEGEL